MRDSQQIHHERSLLRPRQPIPERLRAKFRRLRVQDRASRTEVEDKSQICRAWQICFLKREILRNLVLVDVEVFGDKAVIIIMVPWRHRITAAFWEVQVPLGKQCLHLLLSCSLWDEDVFKFIQKRIHPLCGLGHAGFQSKGRVAGIAE